MPIVIRALEPSDSITQLTELLHEAYRQLGAQGLNYTAVDQDLATTSTRIARGSCIVAELDGQIVGTITWYRPGTQSHCAWYERPGVAVFGQFAVRPQFQRRGVGALLISEVARSARDAEATELALDTAEPARHLIEYYARLGFRLVDIVQWTGKTYRSVIMSKSL